MRGITPLVSQPLELPISLSLGTGCTCLPSTKNMLQPRKISSCAHSFNFVFSSWRQKFLYGLEYHEVEMMGSVIPFVGIRSAVFFIYELITLSLQLM